LPSTSVSRLALVAAETENNIEGYFSRIALTMVVFPAPLGAETTMSFPRDIPWDLFI
jgi:hypothetical protein